MSETKAAAGAAQVETLAAALGDTLPADWQDALALQARQAHLAALAYSAADSGVELILAYHRGERLTADGQRVMAFIDALLVLDRGWRCFVRDTETDAEAIVTGALEFWGGTLIALYVQASLDQIREHERVIIRELHPDT